MARRRGAHCRICRVLASKRETAGDAAARAQEFKACYAHVPAKYHDTMFDVYCQARALLAAAQRTALALTQALAPASPPQSVVQLRAMAQARAAPSAQLLPPAALLRGR